MARARRLPDFAGVALVDILANGLAMLIIVIVLSIASRAEHEERTSAQVEEVETMMSRRFSTSLVLNSLAASPPAQLHDYDNSPLDREHDPHLLPIIELHRHFVREFYTGAVWHREELLREPNAMDAYLTGFDDERKRRLRTDVYDVAQYYLAMSILRDHGIAVRHWHFLPGGLSVAQAGRCPPGVAAKDCAGGALSEAPPDLPALLSSGGEGNGGGGEGGGETWPPPGFPGEGGGGGEGASSAPFPGGAALGGVGGGLLGAGDGLLRDAPGGAGEGSFPNARPGRGGGGDGSGNGLSGLGGNPDGAPQRTRFRLSSPESLREDQDQPALGGANPNPSPDEILAVLLDFTARLQATLDAGASPSALLENFQRRIQFALAAPPKLEGAKRTLVDFLMLELWAADDVGDTSPLEVIASERGARAPTDLIVETNRRLRRVTVARAGEGEGGGASLLPDATRPTLRMNAHPDVWRGLSLPLERNAILLLPPDPQRREELRWRALAYIAPGFDDFIIGFAYAAIDADGRLAVRAEDNRVRLDGRPLHTPYREALFGARTWLVALYAALVLGLLGLLLLVRRVAWARHG